MHGSQEVLVSFLNNEDLIQRHGTLKITELKLSLITELFSHFAKKKSIKAYILRYFKESNITEKRCLVKYSSELHEIALMKKFADIKSEYPKTLPKKEQ